MVHVYFLGALFVMAKYLVIKKNIIFFKSLALLLFVLLPAVAPCKEVSSMIAQMVLESEMLMNSGDFEEARAVLEQALRITPKEPKLYFYLGAVYSRLGLPDEAANAYESAIRIHPGYFKALSELARVYSSLGRWDDAAAVYGKISEIDPSSARPYFEKAMIFRNQGLKDEEREALAEAYRLNPEFVILSARLQNFEIDELLTERESAGKTAGSHVQIKNTDRTEKESTKSQSFLPPLKKIKKTSAREENEKFYWLYILIMLTTLIVIWGGKKRKDL